MKRIVLFADGTGNTRKEVFRTNVWKMYDAMSKDPRDAQVAYYHDGVGTSALAPLRILGGVFGYGLARNVRTLYDFLCLNYERGDKIYIFGFSRGAFTARVLAGMIASQGVRTIEDETERGRWVGEAHRANRRRISLAQVGRIRRTLFLGWRALRDTLAPPQVWPDKPFRPAVRMVGVWDTVAAYGGPIVEMVRGYDRWIWPLSMPDYTLSPRVLKARHALALDEEREAFLPLPWDEVASRYPGRIRQVWFAGVHSDVGGGYPDEGLSAIPLVWMMDEAKAAGLRFTRATELAIRRAVDARAPMHDSRSGVGIAYRYQPRSINSLMGLTPESPLRDPASGDQPMMKQAIVHRSVLTRIRFPDNYAPIVLPTSFVDDGGRAVTLVAAQRNTIWSLVDQRRRLQRMLLAVVGAAVFAPLYYDGSLIGLVDQGLAAPLGLVLGSIPGVPGWMKAAYIGAGFWLSVCAVAGFALVTMGDRRRVAIQRVSAAMWDASRQLMPAESMPAAAPSRANPWLTFRRAFLRRMRWQILPGVFGLSFYLSIALAMVVATVQVSIATRELSGRLCPYATTGTLDFATAEPCHALGVSVTKDRRYQVSITVNREWDDGGLATDPKGFTYVESFSNQPRWGPALKGLVVHLFGIVLRREVTAHWFQPVLAIRDGKSPWLSKVILKPVQAGDRSYHAVFTAPANGVLSIYVNDATVPWFDPKTDLFYDRPQTANRGRGRVSVTEEF